VLSVELERAMGLLGVGTVRELRARMAAGEELVRRRHSSPRDSRIAALSTGDTAAECSDSVLM
jgi:hypothetical protein